MHFLALTCTSSSGFFLADVRSSGTLLSNKIWKKVSFSHWHHAVLVCAIVQQNASSELRKGLTHGTLQKRPVHVAAKQVVLHSGWGMLMAWTLHLRRKKESLVQQSHPFCSTLNTQTLKADGMGDIFCYGKHPYQKKGCTNTAWYKLRTFELDAAPGDALKLVSYKKEVSDFHVAKNEEALVSTASFSTVSNSESESCFSNSLRSDVVASLMLARFMPQPANTRFQIPGTLILQSRHWEHMALNAYHLV